MLEVPSLLFQLDELLERVDFLSVGSNDLMQFLYAADRGNAACRRPLRSTVGAGAARAAATSPSKAKEHDKPVTLCGELASKPIGALALVAHRLSLAVAVAVGARAGQGDAARARRRARPPRRCIDRR